MVLRALAAGAALLLLFPCAGSAQWTGFLRLDRIKGESQDTNHLNWIDVATVGVANFINTNMVLGTKGHTGSQSPLSFLKNFDSTSPTLAFLCAKGTSIPSGTLDLTTNSATGPFLRLEMTNIHIASVSQSGSDSSIAESIQFQAQIFSWYYTQFNTNSGLPSYLNTLWNFSAGGGTVSTNAPITMTTGIRMANGVELQWNAVSGQSYRIFAVPRLGAPFTFVSFQTATNTGTMTFDLPAANNAMFYVVEHLP